MDGDEVPLYGRDAAIGLVREFLTRDERDGGPLSRQTPVVVFAGPPGSGKSELLKGLARRGRDRVPGALVDCTDFAGRARELLALLAFELNRDSGRYGRVPFPRLITGLIAIDVDVSDLPRKADRDAARDRMRKALEDRTNTAGKLQATVQDVLDAGIGAVAGPQSEWAKAALALISKVGPQLVLGGLVKFRLGRRIVLGKGQEWYGHRDGQANADALDALIDVNRKAASTAKADKTATTAQAAQAAEAARVARREAADWLWDAFLADLAAAFARRRAVNWTFNCLVLLDGADDGAGELFLRQLVAARRRRAEAGLAPDPLTVVATSNGLLADELQPRDGVMAALADASYADYQQRIADHPGWYPVSLPYLSAEDVAVMASREFGLPSGTRRGGVASAVYRYTHGHTGAVRALLQAMGDAKRTDLATILERPAPGTGEPLADALLGELLAGASARVTDNLVTASAARDQEAALRLGKVTGLMSGTAWDTDKGILSPTFWDDTQPTERQALHPVLRRLLLRRLAARAADAPASWVNVHSRLSKISLDAGDETGVLYHSLACGDVKTVALRLASALGTMDAREWLDMLEAVTAAPSNLAPAQLAASHIGALTDWASPDDKLAAATGRLVAAMWIDADPRGEPGRREVREEAAAALGEIASDPRLAGTIALRRYARKEFADDADWRDGWIATAAAPARDDVFDPPKSAAGEALLRRGKLAAAAMAVVVAAGGGAGIYRAVSDQSCGATSAPFQLAWDDGECVGVTDATLGPLPGSDSGIADIENKIGAANKQAVAKNNYVTIALLGTFTPSSAKDADVSPGRIVDTLRGAYLAVQDANGPGSALPYAVRLVLANVGNAGQGVPQVAGQLARLASATGPGRLLAIAGMGISQTPTKNAAQLLGRTGQGGQPGADIPMFGAVTTADDLSQRQADPDLVRVVPGVSAQVARLRQVLQAPGQVLAPGSTGQEPPMVLVLDANASDLYTTSMITDFDHAWPQVEPASARKSYLPGELTTPGQFASIASQYCPSSHPPVILYAGRESVLGTFIAQLQNDQYCRNKQVTIVTASDANALPASVMSSSAGGARVTVIYSDIELPSIDPRFPPKYSEWLRTQAGVCDPWMMATFDATTAAWRVIKVALSPPSVGSAPSPDQLTAHDTAGALNSLYGVPLPGAAGDFSIASNGERADTFIPVIELSAAGRKILDKKSMPVTEALCAGYS